VAEACVREFLAAEFEGGRHVRRVAKIAALEAEEAGR
jgi:ribose 5-phosphate isomerase RpiB